MSLEARETRLSKKAPIARLLSSYQPVRKIMKSITDHNDADQIVKAWRSLNTAQKTMFHDVYHFDLEVFKMIG